MDQVTERGAGATIGILAIALLLTQGCSFLHPVGGAPFSVSEVHEQLRPLDPVQPFEAPQLVRKYFDFFHLDSPDAQHWFGTVQSGGETLAVHWYLPEDPCGTLVLLHGLFDHAGVLSHLIQASVDRDYAVLVFDLPGHGLSSGEPTDIGSIMDCANHFDTVIRQMAPYCPPPIHCVAHSAGCMITLEYLYQHAGREPLDRVCFMAPLVRNAHWGWSRFGYAIARPFTGQIRRIDKMNSSNAAYNDSVERDPLQSTTLSFRFLESIYAWNEAAESYPDWPGAFLLIQGDEDGVLDWEYNLGYLEQRLEEPHTLMIEGARHQLPNESPPLRDQAFRAIFEWLDQP